jgi:hypothetical protein
VLRRILACASNLLTHHEKKTPLWFDFTEEELTSPICTQMHFIEPLAWMTTVPQNLQGKLYCPNQNCKSKLGSFSWILGTYVYIYNTYAMISILFLRLSLK